jgi:hypothetical protein
MQIPFCSRSLTPNDGSINGEAEKKSSLGNELTTKTSLERAKGWVKLMLAAEKGWSRNFPCSPLFIFSGQKVHRSNYYDYGLVYRRRSISYLRATEGQRYCGSRDLAILSVGLLRGYHRQAVGLCLSVTRRLFLYAVELCGCAALSTSL